MSRVLILCIAHFSCIVSTFIIKFVSTYSLKITLNFFLLYTPTSSRLNLHYKETSSQDTKNRYDMFEEFMSQSSTELVARNQAIDNLLQESNSKNSVFREKQRSCLNQLMETVVKGLDTAVEMRDSQHGIITTTN